MAMDDYGDEIAAPEEPLTLARLDDTEAPIELVPFETISRCPSCGSEKSKVHISVHEVGHLDGPCGKIFGWPRLLRLPKHLCYQCTACWEVWVTAPRHPAVAMPGAAGG